jgi:hypothetical protein
MFLNMKTLLLPLLLIVCLVGDTITRAITARTAPDFAMRAFASTSHPEGSCRSSMQRILVTERNTI